MSIESIIVHMNKYHKEDLAVLVKKMGIVENIDEVVLQSVDSYGLSISYNNSNSFRIDFPEKANEENLKDVIIKLCFDAKESLNYEKIKKEIQEFKKEFRSICLATLSPRGKVECTYAPFIQTAWGDYIYISEIATHYSNIKHNPNNIEILFIQDEIKAPSVILRKRLRYEVKAKFIQRGDEFEKTYDEFEKNTNGENSVKVIKNMLDFHLVKLALGEGSFVRGFGQAYKILESGEIEHLKGKNPHKSNLYK